MSEVMDSNQWELLTTTCVAKLQPLASLRKAMKSISYSSKSVGNGMQNTQSQSSISSPSSQLLLFLSDQDKCFDHDNTL
jgi:hypothetical protein